VFRPKAVLAACAGIAGVAALCAVARADLTFEAPPGWVNDHVHSKPIRLDDKANVALVGRFSPADKSGARIEIYAYDDTESYALRVQYLRSHMDAMGDQFFIGAHPAARQVTQDDDVEICAGIGKGHLFAFVDNAIGNPHPLAGEFLFVDNGAQRYLLAYTRPSGAAADPAASAALRSVCPKPLAKPSPEADVPATPAPTGT